MLDITCYVFFVCFFCFLDRTMKTKSQICGQVLPKPNLKNVTSRNITFLWLISLYTLI